MAACRNQPLLAPDYARVSNRFHRVVSNWSLPDLDKVIWALERDNMLSVEELSRIVPSKKIEEIEQLISLCLSSEEADFGGNLEPQRISTEESTLEIIKNSVKSVVPGQFSPGPGISSVLRDIAKKERFNNMDNVCGAKRLGGHKGFILPDYGRIYEYIADLLTLAKTRPHIGDSDMVVLLDMLFCLLQATDYLLRKGSAGDIEQAFSVVRDKIGVLISSISASYQHRCAFLKQISVSSVYDIDSLTSCFPQAALTSAPCRPNVLPYMAPILVVKEARLSYNVSQCALLKRTMRDVFRQYWQPPVMKEDEDLQIVHKKLAKFILNPLCLNEKLVPSVCEYLSTLSMLMRHYEERITSLTSITTTESHSFCKQNVLIQSAAKLIADYRSGKKNFVRRISLPVERHEIDKFINAVSFSFPLAMFKAKKASSRQPKLYRRVD
ncbi:unnamed protein product [Hydatigera taeniaeformis]|uniref:DUF5726 domain-containing protein n=1 Tax=Hydatigena taeniaeformis TaxID=6205 RepID=A0A0R3WIU4_HYDTA|nr:unnamed protein product [Hydatigera taeniaeformis]